MACCKNCESGLDCSGNPVQTGAGGCGPCGGGCSSPGDNMAIDPRWLEGPPGTRQLPNNVFQQRLYAAAQALLSTSVCTVQSSTSGNPVVLAFQQAWNASQGNPQLVLDGLYGPITAICASSVGVNIPMCVDYQVGTYVPPQIQNVTRPFAGPVRSPVAPSHGPSYPGQTAYPCIQELMRQGYSEQQAAGMCNTTWVEPGKTQTFAGPPRTLGAGATGATGMSAGVYVAGAVAVIAAGTADYLAFTGPKASPHASAPRRRRRR